MRAPRIAPAPAHLLACRPAGGVAGLRARSWNHQKLARRDARFERAMGVGDFIESIGLEDSLLQAAVTDPCENLVGATTKLPAIGYIMVKAGAGEIKRFTKQ